MSVISVGRVGANEQGCARDGLRNGDWNKVESERRGKMRVRKKGCRAEKIKAPTKTEVAALGVVHVHENGTKKERNEKAHYVEAGGNPQQDFAEAGSAFAGLGIFGRTCLRS